MSIWLRRSVTHELTRIGLVLSPRRGRRRWLVRSALIFGALTLGAGGSYLYLDPAQREAQPQAAAQQERTLLQQQLEQTRLTLNMSEARSKELEHQIDALNQKLRECQDEMTFFRKAHEGKQ